MKKLTNLLLAGKVKERRKKQYEDAAIGGVKVQFKWQSRNESNWLIHVAVLGFA